MRCTYQPPSTCRSYCGVRWTAGDEAAVLRSGKAEFSGSQWTGGAPARALVQEVKHAGLSRQACCIRSKYRSCTCRGYCEVLAGLQRA
jgi:hypothetical protein